MEEQEHWVLFPRLISLRQHDSVRQAVAGSAYEIAIQVSGQILRLQGDEQCKAQKEKHGAFHGGENFEYEWTFFAFVQSYSEFACCQIISNVEKLRT